MRSHLRTGLHSGNVFATGAGVNTLLYLLYGEAEEFQLELTYSVLTGIAQAGASRDFRIVLACEEDNRREDLPVEHLPISRKELFDWTFGGRFGHGAKIGVVAKAATRYGGKVALIDTDTYFLESPSEIFDRIDERHAVMHRDEGPLARHSQGQTYRTLMASYSGQYPFDEHSHMFNAGVVGFGARSRPLLDDVAEMTKDLIDLASAPLHTFEQFAFSVVLGTNFNVRTVEDVVRHYTGPKRRFVHARIREILPSFASMASDAMILLRHDVERAPPKRLIDVARSRFKARSRPGLTDYASAYLCYLSALSARSPGLANAWAGTTLDYIIWNNYPRDVVANDFGKLRDDRLAALDWLDPRVRDRWTAYWR